MLHIVRVQRFGKRESARVGRKPAKIGADVPFLHAVPTIAETVGTTPTVDELIQRAWDNLLQRRAIEAAEAVSSALRICAPAVPIVQCERVLTLVLRTVRDHSRQRTPDIDRAVGLMSRKLAANVRDQDKRELLCRALASSGYRGLAERLFSNN